MAQATNIEWTEQSWNFLRGCRRVSKGCGCDEGGGCYAERQAIRHAGQGGAYEGLVKSTPKGPRWTGEISFHKDILLAPLRRKTPTTYFVNSMSDLFYEKVTDEMIDKAFAVMALCPQHTFQILTKRPERMKAYMKRLRAYTDSVDGFDEFLKSPIAHFMRCISKAQGNPFYTNAPLALYDNDESWKADPETISRTNGTPPRNVWLGVSVEDQKTADERIPLLLATPAAIRWISAEPLLGSINLRNVYDKWHNFGGELDTLRGIDTKHQCDLTGKLDWVVVGGESGPRARPCDIAWIRSIVDQCRAAGVPVFVKQLGAVPIVADREWRHGNGSNGITGHLLNASNHKRTPEGFVPLKYYDRKGGDPSEWPEDLRVREFPNVETSNADKT